MSGWCDIKPFVVALRLNGVKLNSHNETKVSLPRTSEQELPGLVLVRLEGRLFVSHSQLGESTTSVALVVLRLH